MLFIFFLKSNLDRKYDNPMISPIFSPIPNQKFLNHQHDYHQQQLFDPSYLVTTQPSQQPIFVNNGFNTNSAASITNTASEF